LGQAASACRILIRMDRDGLAHFLRRRRAELQPDDVGLHAGARRRTDGLRREEVALLASMSTDFYTRLEQGRGARPSSLTAAALARALRLTDDERDHLFRLAGHPTPPRTPREDQPDPALLALLERLDTPAHVTTALGVTLAQNEPSIELLGDLTRFTGLQRSVMYRWFTDPGEGAHFPARDHERHSRSYVAHLRAVSARRAGDAEAQELIAALRAASAEFAHLWEHHDVAVRARMRKDVIHPRLGLLAYDCQLLRSADDAQQLVVYTPAATRAPTRDIDGRDPGARRAMVAT
jgi:transcriptional regulator with XRE-family HTH domain